MTKQVRLLLFGVATVSVATGVWMIMSPHLTSNSGMVLNQTQSSGSSSRAPANLNQPGLAAPGLTARTANPAKVEQVPAARDVETLVKDFDSLFALSAGAAADRDLLGRRQLAGRELLTTLSNLGEGGSRSIAQAFKQTDALRDKRLLAQSLGKIQDSQAVPVLKELLSSESGFYERKELIASLAHRTEPAAIEPLSAVLTSQQQGGLQFSAVQGLAGRAEALPVLTATIENGNDQAVRLEAIRSVGLIRNDAAKNELITLAQGASLESIIRQTAIQELRRSFGPGAQDVLQTLSNDSEPAIRDTATQALAMLRR